MLSAPRRIDPLFKLIADQIESSNDHIWVTGKAGTGKSTLLKLIQDSTSKRMVTLAPTGVAALNVRGQTIHSFFRFAPRLYAGERISRRKNVRLYQAIDTIIIDEISMVRADLMDQIDQFLRVQRDTEKPFGGVQMIFFGDIFQLPPVVRSDERAILNAYYKAPYFFCAHVMSEIELRAFELDKVYRQKDQYFIRLLDEIRLNKADWDTMEAFAECIDHDFNPPPFCITLATRNSIVQQINKTKLAQIDMPMLSYTAKVEGLFNVNQRPAEPIVQLKEGAQVMLLRNDPQLEYVNGSIGIYRGEEDDRLLVELDDPIDGLKTVKIGKVSWDIIKYDYVDQKVSAQTVGTFTQYPVRMAWAITIHKSQGQTFDQVFLDMGRGAFEYGQTYVALSRCTTLEGLKLKRGLRPKDILVDPIVVEFYARLTDR